ncbi:hypothetical protein IFM89_021109 [Coptis chinensis]|uniref:Uncharacterized protein n=1 Tax=Coptis chinensis TaxID=261450 RepID=A0A835LN12_9MAGN|nr:hypothetical protein IFM89_021109 [Coptis chinensis]
MSKNQKKKWRKKKAKSNASVNNEGTLGTKDSQGVEVPVVVEAPSDSGNGPADPIGVVGVQAQVVTEEAVVSTRWADMCENQDEGFTLVTSKRVNKRRDPLEAGSQAATLVSEIRRRKGLKEQMTPLSEFEDKL